MRDEPRLVKHKTVVFNELDKRATFIILRHKQLTISRESIDDEKIDGDKKLTLHSNFKCTTYLGSTHD